VAAADARLSHAFPFEVGPFLMDRYETTNQEYLELVDAGGYTRRDLWEHPFERDGRTIGWEEAIAAFVDRTGRPGPATWTGGTFPAGEGEYPVTGISWYEAAAYARFRGRHLPTIYHWIMTAVPTIAANIVPFSNFGGQGAAPVGSSLGITPPGAYDMAGNAREWLANPTGSLRYTAGGGWNDPEYSFGLMQPQSPWDRSETNGVRLMTDMGSSTAFAEAGRNIDFVTRDFFAETPASDERFAALLEFYRYDDLPLNAVIESVDTVEVGIRERITFDSGYGPDRMMLHLFRPLDATGALQTVLFFPGSGALNAPEMGGGPLTSMIVRSGRAFAVPVFEGMYERQDDYDYRLQDESNDHRDHVLHWRQDLARSLDYLETRPEIDRDRFAYLGVSLGGRMGAIMLAVEPRFRAAVLHVPGLSPMPTQAVVDPFNFLPRVTLPVLMLSGEYDQTYPLEESARPFYAFLGTKEPDKRHFIAEGGHIIPEIDATRETLDWLDRYLGETR
jgi:dienelactone hydrolase